MHSNLVGLAARQLAGRKEYGGRRLLGAPRRNLLPADQDVRKAGGGAAGHQLAALDLRVAYHTQVDNTK